MWTKFPQEGSKHTPRHNSCDFRWKDYCPQVFRLVITHHSPFQSYIYDVSSFLCHYADQHTICSKPNRRTLRKLFKVDAADYMLSLCGSEALRELSSPGKSGSFFYLTNDDRYMIKTMKKSEVKVCSSWFPLSLGFLSFIHNSRSFMLTARNTC